MIAAFLLTLLYSQVTVAVPGRARGLLWTDDHVAQGFAWSPGFVSFGVPDHDGHVKVVIQRSSAFQATAQTLWAVQTPFDVDDSCLEVGTIGSEQSVSIAAGRYNLIFEARPPGPGSSGDVAYIVYLHFIETPAPSFAILKQGDVLQTDRILSTWADPA